MRRILLLGAVLLSAALSWFAVSNYLRARPIAEENLRGLALSFTATIENIAVHAPTLQSLSSIQSRDIAFFALVDQQGVFRYHTNPDLIGTPSGTVIPQAIFQGATSSERIRLQTGENAFEFRAPVYLPWETLALRLTLHTYRADAVVRQARLNMAVLFGLLAAGWALALALYRLSRREERRALEMARRESLAKLGEMGAMLAHEIRNPLAGIKGYAQVIEKKPVEERNSRFAQRIVVETQRLEALVNNLLDYARSDGHPTDAVDLGALLCHAAELLQPDAEASRIAITCDCPVGLRTTGDPDRLGQVLLNLGRNALHAMPDGGQLEMTAERLGKKVAIKVIDTGRGISQADQARVFEPFFTTKAKGTGLGLSLCKKIVEEHDGTIEVQSAAGTGTSVTITLPGHPHDKSRSYA